MIERLSSEMIAEYNQVLCRDTGENHAVLDPNGLAAATERPWVGFGDEEMFPSLFEKAAALLHGLASRQVFENGNKRTAWAAAVAFLDFNGIDIGPVNPVQSDMFVRASALDHILEIADIAEWFDVVVSNRRAGPTAHPQIEYLVPARGWAPGDAGGTCTILDMQVQGVVVAGFPSVCDLAVICRVHWRAADADRHHRFEIKFDPASEALRPLPDQVLVLDELVVAPSGHEHHADSLLPSLLSIGFRAEVIAAGDTAIIATLDDVEVGRIPLSVEYVSQVTF